MDIYNKLDSFNKNNTYKKVKWYASRLKAMSFKEMLQRTKFSLFIKRSLRKQCSHTLIFPKPQIDNLRNDWWELPNVGLGNSLEYRALLVEAQNYLAGKYTFLSVPCQEFSLDWHRDPQTGKKAPCNFALDLDYRDFELVGNVKNIWEKNRHHHLTVLATAYALTKDDKYANEVAKQLKDWVTKNPFPMGINWSSSLELGIRLISWVWIDRLLRGSKSHSLLFGSSGILWSSIYWHQWLISKHHSYGSSANNHLIGEIAGLFISSCHWQVFPQSKKWQSLAWKILEREISIQTYPSGLNREQAFSYHIFATEFFLLAGIEAQMHRISLSDRYKNLVRKILEAIPSLTDIGGNLPNYGDGDEGIVLQLRSHSSSRIDWLFRLGRQWLKANVPLPNNESGYLAASLINLPLEDTVEAIEPIENCHAFSDAGIYVLTQNRGKPEEIFCLADAGELGFLSIAAHGHADALSFTLSIGGVPIVVDPGTYVYHADARWRSYFRSTKAHNTIAIDDLDQSKPEGTFLWTKKAKTKLIKWLDSEERTVLEAEHDGYTRLEGGMTHRRRLTLDSNKLEIFDNLQGQGTHEIQWRLHFSPQCKVNFQQDCCTITWEAGSVSICLDKQLEWTLLQGENDGGWYSSHFNLKEPSSTLVGRAKINGSISLQNSFDLSTLNFNNKLDNQTKVANSLV